MMAYCHDYYGSSKKVIIYVYCTASPGAILIRRQECGFFPAYDTIFAAQWHGQAAA